MGHSRILPPTRFDKADRVLDHEGNEGIVTEVFVTYPARGDFADWTKPAMHYQVCFFGGDLDQNLSFPGPPTITATRLHLEGELTEASQTQLPFTNDNLLSKSDQEEWSFRNM